MFDNKTLIDIVMANADSLVQLPTGLCGMIE